jgi:hypothetical protein
MNDFKSKLIKMLSVKIDNGEEKNITKDDLQRIQIIYSDNNGEIGKPMIPYSLSSKLSNETLEEIKYL